MGSLLFAVGVWAAWEEALPTTVWSRATPRCHASIALFAKSTVSKSNDPISFFGTTYRRELATTRPAR
jgi:hypothetical protein